MLSTVAVIGIDIGKNSFHIVGLDGGGAIVLRQKWSRGQVEARLANVPLCLIGMEACVGANHLSRKLKALGHDARLMRAKYVRPYSKGQKNDFRDAETIAQAVQRPTMKFVATKNCRSARPAGASPGAGAIGQSTHRHHQPNPRLLARARRCGASGTSVLACELPRILAAPPEVLSPRMVHLIEGLAEDWRRLDEPIDCLSGEITAVARLDAGCERLVSVPASDRSSPAPLWPRSVLTARSLKVATLLPGWVLCLSRSRPATAPYSARYRSAVTATCAFCSCRPPGWCLSSRRVGSAMGSSAGSRPPRSGCTAMCSLSRSPTSLRALPGRAGTWPNFRGAAGRFCASC